METKCEVFETMQDFPGSGIKIKTENLDEVKFNIEDLHHSIDIKEEDHEVEKDPNKYKTDKRALGLHLKVHPVEKSFSCGICGYKCTLKTKLRKHIMRTHAGEKPFKCKFCEYKCTQKTCLKKHIKTHTRKKSFECTICDYKCSKKSNLDSHLKTHTEEESLPLNLCHHKFSLKENLETHNGEKSFSCKICACKISLKPYLIKRRLKTHTGEKPFYFQICDCKYASTFLKKL